MKKQKIFIGIIIALFVITAIYILFILKKNDSNSLNKQNNNVGFTCLEKGKKCTDDQIISGITKDVKVNDKETFTFNVIDNDENTLTLLMNKNILEKVNWKQDLINYQGPVSLFLSINELENPWTAIDVISDYTYEDYGKKNYEYMRQGLPNIDFFKRGYTNLSIKDGIVSFKYNINVNEYKEFKQKDEITYKDTKINMRAITFEEIEKLKKDDKYPEWLFGNLKENFGYWTISSSTINDMTNTAEAYAILNESGKKSLSSLFTANGINSYTIGLRPVIIINK